METLSRLTVIFLMNALWQIALVAGVAILLDRWLRGAPARYRHVLWTMTLFAATILPLVSARPMQKHRAAPAMTTAGTVAAAVAALPPETAAYAALRVRDHDASRLASTRSALRAALGGAHPGIRVPQNVARVMFFVYLCFLALMLARFGRAWSHTRQTRRLASPRVLPEHVAAILKRYGLATATRGSRSSTSPVVLWSSQVTGPVTVGALRPAIILPCCLRDPAAEEDLRAAIAHEMAHVRRRDYLSNLICELLLLPVAFHPLAQIIRSRLTESRELACDELAAGALGSARYARSLVRMAHQISGLALPASLRPDYTLGVFDADILEERVMRLLKPRASMRLAKCSLFCAALLVAGSCLAAASFSVSAAENPQSTETNQINSNPSLTGGVTGGVAGGVLGGVPSSSSSAVTGGVIRGVPGGTSGGVSGGVNAKTSRVLGGPVAHLFVSKESDKTGSLSGIVVDSSGARIPKAEVRLISRNTSFQQTVESDETGNFAFDNVPGGRYSLEVSSPGMGGALRSFEFKAVGEPPYFPFVLHPGNVTENTVVTAQGPPDRARASAVGPRKIRIGGAVAAAKVVESSHISPEYPQEAKDKGIEGLVVLEATISADGVPSHLKVVSSPDESLSQAATDAVKQWRYQPTLLNGEPVEVLTTIDVDFRLQN